MIIASRIEASTGESGHPGAVAACAEQVFRAATASAKPKTPRLSDHALRARVF